EEGRLTDARIRENFVERIFAAARWRAFMTERPRARDLVAFHAQQKYAVLAHSPSLYRPLGRLVARAGTTPATRLFAEYSARLAEALAVPASRARHVNVL